jgi:uncharacterized membrane protein
MNELLVACATFVALHLLVSGTAVRGAVVQSIGEGPYRGLFSLGSLAALVWMSVAYGRIEPDASAVLWSAPPWWGTALGPVVNLVAFVFIVVGASTPNPTAMQEDLVHDTESTRGFVRISRHPMLMGFVLWSAYHMSANGDVGSLVFFGTFFITGLLGPRAIDAKRAKKLGAAWGPFVEKTSVVPFAAILQGRNRLALDEVRAGQWLAAVGFFLLFYLGHGWMFGVAVAPL